MPRRVPTFHDFVGHKKLVDLLLRQRDGSRVRGKPFPHTVLTGASGLGKTLLARALAAEFGTKLVMAMGDVAKADLADKLVTLDTNDFLFIDEAHALKSAVQEMLYDVIDHYCVPRVPGSVTAGAPLQQGETTIQIKPCTIILATDRPGCLLNALQKRMLLRVALNYYSVEELKAIVERMATDVNLLISPHATKLIAQVSGGLPRRAEHHLHNLRNHFPSSEDQQISIAQVREFLEAFDIDDKGLGAQDRQYLKYLAEVGVASIESLAICLGLDCDFVRYQVEPLLLRERLVTIGPGGRRLTAEGQAWINQLEQNDPPRDAAANGND